MIISKHRNLFACKCEDMNNKVVHTFHCLDRIVKNMKNIVFHTFFHTTRTCEDMKALIFTPNVLVFTPKILLKYERGWDKALFKKKESSLFMAGGGYFEGVTYFWQVVDGWGHFFVSEIFKKARENHFMHISAKNKTKNFLGGEFFLHARKSKYSPPAINNEHSLNYLRKIFFKMNSNNCFINYHIGINSV